MDEYYARTAAAEGSAESLAVTLTAETYRS
jgi:hypothetical protein